MKPYISFSDKENQQGTALLLALLVMTALVIAGVTLGGIAVSEIRQSRQLDQAIAAFYAAESGVEKLVFDWRDTRDNGLFTSPRCDESSDTGWTCQMSVGSGISQISFSLDQLQVEQVPLYLPSDLSAPAGADSMKIYWQDQDIDNLQEPWLEVTLLGWRAASQVNFENDTTISKKVFKCSYPNLSEPDCDIITLNDLSVDESYIVRVRPLYDNIEQVRIKFYIQDNGVGDLDLSNYIKIADFTGEYQGIKQGLRVQFPVVEQSSAMFDFVLFTEESLLKDIF